MYAANNNKQETSITVLVEIFKLNSFWLLKSIDRMMLKYVCCRRLNQDAVQELTIERQVNKLNSLVQRSFIAVSCFLADITSKF